MKVSIIGNGRFGNLLYKTLKKNKRFEVFVFSRRANPDGEKFISLEEAAKSDIIIPTVPISFYKETANKIAPYINKDALIVDVASVKLYTTNALIQNLPTTVDILSTHPMFGPDSTNDGKDFSDLKFIYWKERIHNERRTQIFLEFWKQKGCELVELSPEEHDKQAAYTHAFAFMIGKMGIEMGVRKNYITTKGLEGILYNQEAVENDTSELFDDMMRYNPFAKDMLQDAKNALDLIIKNVSYD